jgi:hypothetical protein
MPLNTYRVRQCEAGYGPLADHERDSAQNKIDIHGDLGAAQSKHTCNEHKS